ncbi:MAG: tyrosine-type recombinase/integrase [Cellvibrionales bacterium]|nr:tyrosine-type recombinase/integrase [Cellvibrionales bacterium]
MSQFKATPLFDAHKSFVRLPMGVAMLDEYPDSKLFIETLCKTNPDIIQDFIQSQAFLKSYSRKSEATYRSYRNEVERLLLWSWTITDKTIIQLKRPELEAFFDFVHNPPANWVADSVQDRFKQIGGEWLQNENWRPFAAKISKQDRKKALAGGLEVNPDKSGHKLSGEAMKICFSAISCFYDYLTDEGYAFGNPIPAIRKQSPYLIKGATQKSIKRLSDLQWDYVLGCAESAANADSSYERMLFVVSLLKSLYMRVSELSDRCNWQPVWQHFWEDSDGNHWLKVLGKGNKLRDISVPSALFPYIKRYKNYRSEASSNFNTNAALVSKNRGSGGMTSRQIRRIVQEAFDMAFDKMLAEGFADEARALREATTHWLRHTGASQDIATRPLKHMADDLGHASMGTTDQVYIQSDMKERARSGKDRDV